MSTTTPAQQIEHAIRLIESVAGDARGQGFGTRELGNADLVHMVQLAENAGRLIAAMQVEIAHEVSVRTTRKVPADVSESLAHSYGFGSAVDMLKDLTCESGAALTRRIKLGSVCRTEISLLGEELPGRFASVGAAFFTGSMNAATAELITRELCKVSSNVDFETREAAERTLVAYATGGAHEDVGDADRIDRSSQADGAGNPGSPGQGAGFPMHVDDLKRVSARVVTLLDQDGAMPRDEQLGRRHLRFGAERDGLVPLYGSLTADVAAGLARMLDAILNPRAGRAGSMQDGHTVMGETANGQPIGVSPVGGQPRNEHSFNDQPGDVQSRVRFVAADDFDSENVRDDRTPDQRRHDAFASICAIARKHEDMPKLGGEAVSLTIQCTEESLLKRGGTAWLTDHFGQLAPTDSAAARHAACAGSVLRVTQDGRGRIIELDSTARIFNAHQRKAIMLRDGGCIIPGCSQSAMWCEIHHVQEWRDEGKTHTDNGVMLCWYHHRHIETHGWQVRMVDGVPHVQAPLWRDPAGTWRATRSVHKPPKLVGRTETRSQNPDERTSACSVRTTRILYAPRPRLFGLNPAILHGNRGGTVMRANVFGEEARTLIGHWNFNKPHADHRVARVERLDFAHKLTLGRTRHLKRERHERLVVVNLVSDITKLDRRLSGRHTTGCKKRDPTRDEDACRGHPNDLVALAVARATIAV